MVDSADLEDMIRARAVEIVTLASEATLLATVDAAPVGRTSALRDSHAVDPPIDAGTVISADLHVDAPHAVFVAEGTAPHIIVPHKPPRALHFESGGDEVFATIVHHPGTTANTDWWSEAALQARWTAALEAEVS